MSTQNDMSKKSRDRLCERAPTWPEASKTLDHAHSHTLASGFFYKSVYIHSPRNDIGLVTEVKVSQLVLEHLKAEKGLYTVGAVEAICAVGPHSTMLFSVMRRVSYFKSHI